MSQKPTCAYQQIGTKTFDAIVVGSGISGGWAAKELCLHDQHGESKSVHPVHGFDGPGGQSRGGGDEEGEIVNAVVHLLVNNENQQPRIYDYDSSTFAGRLSRPSVTTNQ